MKRTLLSSARPSRRAALAAGAAMALPRILIAQATRPARPLSIAAIGTGGRCSALIQEALRHGERIAAICNVDPAAIASTRKLIATKGSESAAQKVKPYDDWRKLLEAEKGIDAVLIATGDRWHAPIASAFMSAGKHVYCEKPLVHKLSEAQDLIDLSARRKVVTQTGTQGAANKTCRRAIELIRAGLLGQITEAHLWCDGYGANPASHDRPAGEDPVPDGFNWDAWLGPAPVRPFKRGVYHPGCLKFQNWFDFSNGMLAGQGAHTFFLPVAALELSHPVKAEADFPEPIRETYPSKGNFRFEYPARGKLAPLTLHWTDGGGYPPEEITQSLKTGGRAVPKLGMVLIGEKGQLFAGGWGEAAMIRLKDDTAWRGVLDHEAAKPIPATLPRAPGDNHMLEFLTACRSGPATFCPLAMGARVVQAYLPGILSLRLGRAIEWDGGAMRVKSCPEAHPLIQKTYRKKWLL